MDILHTLNTLLIQLPVELKNLSAGSHLFRE